MGLAAGQFKSDILKAIEPSPSGWFGKRATKETIRLWSNIAGAGGCLTSILALLTKYNYRMFIDWSHSKTSYEALIAQMDAGTFFLEQAQRETAPWQTGFFLISAKIRCAAALDRIVATIYENELLVKPQTEKASHMFARVEELKVKPEYPWTVDLWLNRSLCQNSSIDDIRNKIKWYHDNCGVTMKPRDKICDAHLMEIQNSRTFPSKAECAVIQHREVNTFKHDPMGWRHSPLKCLPTDLVMAKLALQFVSDAFQSQIK